MDKITLDIEMIFAVLSGKVTAAINRKLYKEFNRAQIDITPEQWLVLFCLWDKEGITQQQLCEATFKEKPSMTRLIHNLEKQNLVVRIPDKTDKRINLIYLTKKGRELKEKVAPVTASTLTMAVEGLTEEEIRMGEKIFIKVFNNLK